MWFVTHLVRVGMPSASNSGEKGEITCHVENVRNADRLHRILQPQKGSVSSKLNDTLTAVFVVSEVWGNRYSRLVLPRLRKSKCPRGTASLGVLMARTQLVDSGESANT